MSTRNSLILLVVIVCGAGALALRSSRAETAETSELSNTTDFAGKVVMLIVDKSSTLESKTESIVLKDPKIIKLANRYFIHGGPHLIDESEDWFTDGAIGVSWDSVKSYWVFTPKSYEGYMKYRQKQLEEESN